MANFNYSDKELNAYFEDPEARRRPNRKRPKEIARKIVAGIASFSVIAALIGISIALYLAQYTPSFEQLENPEVSLATVAYTADGEVLTRYAYEDRTPVPYDSISPHVINALIATEDYRFPEHWGVDVFRTFTAAFVYPLLKGDQQGGSTISQQLARNLYKQIGFEVTLTRKIKEWITAVQLERAYTKQEIIEMYLTTVPFGQRTFGIETAAQTYFGVSAGELTLEQAAVLIGMLKATTAYNPVRNPERSLQRRNIVINQMERFGNLPQHVADSAKTKPLELDFTPVTHTQNLAPFFAEQVRLFMDKWASENGYDTYTDGLVVYTTLDSRLQKHAQAAVDKYMPALQSVVDVEWSSAGAGFFRYDIEPYVEFAAQEDFEPFDRFWNQEREFVNTLIVDTERYQKRRRQGEPRAEIIAALRQDEAFMDSLRVDATRLEVGFVALDPYTRHVKAWVGGRDYNVGKLDHVNGTRRQPGSTFKPFLYTAAIDNGYSPYYRLLDDSVTIFLPGMPEPWSPGNSGDEFTGRMLTLRDGLRKSINTVAARLVGEVGGEQVQAYARRMGINSPLEPVPSIALGTSDVTLLEMSNAYATLASGGFHGDPIFVTRIETRSGEVLDEFASTQTEVLSEHTAYTMIDMLRGSMMPGGTGVRIRSQFGITSDVAGKTGTTQNSADGWFVLLHPQMVSAGWVGFNKPTLTFRTNYWGQGAHNALFVVADCFKSVLEDEDLAFPDSEFLAPEGWTVPLPMPVNLEDQDDRKIGADRKGKVGW